MGPYLHAADKDNLLLREAHASDLNFIQSTFLKSMKRESSLGRSCSTRVFFQEFPQVIDHILNVSKVLVASSKEDPNFIYGYLIYEPEVVHYTYVRGTCRNLEVAKEMIAHAFPGAKTLTFSQNTNSSKQIKEKYPELIWNPFVLYHKGA